MSTAAGISLPLMVDALGPSGSFRTRQRTALQDVSGRELGSLSLVPSLFVTRTISAMRKAPSMGYAERIEALARAGEMFDTETIEGLSPAHYQHLVSRISGTPIAAVRTTSRQIATVAAEAPRNLVSAQPTGSILDWRDEGALEGRSLWTQRGKVFGVHAAGNHPGVHLDWIDAIVLGYHVAIRPSRREPLTAQRLVASLRLSGLADDQIAFLPTDHSGADEMLRASDLSMVYGGDEVMRKYADRPEVRPMGPGRSKILLTAEAEQIDAIELIVESVAADGGVGCVNATAVFVEGDPAAVAEAVSVRLAAIPSLPPEDEAARLPVQPAESARALEQHLLAKAQGATPWLGGDGIVDVLDDGSAALRPAVHQVDSATASQLGLELAFPCVWVAPWSRKDGVAPLRDALVLTAVTDDEELIDELAKEPTIGNLHIGPVPTYWSRPWLPHDGYLADFLMRSKTVVRG